MSVAFRRDGDEEHLEPKFEIPLPPGPNWVTPAGLALIGARVAEWTARLAACADETERTAIARDLRYWKARAASAQVPPRAPGDTAEFGCTVRFTLNGQARSITIVGHDEAEPAQGRLAFTAPLARALMGAEPGESLPFNGREDAITVLEIAPPA